MLAADYTYLSFQSTIFLIFGFWDVNNMLGMYINGG
jgi:hypothetical protein